MRAVELEHEGGGDSADNGGHAGNHPGEGEQFLAAALRVLLRLNDHQCVHDDVDESAAERHQR